MSAWTSALLGALSGIGGLFPQNQTQTSSSSSKSTPLFGAPEQGLKDFLINAYRDMLTGSPQFEDAYTRSGLSRIGKQNERLVGSVDDLLSARGLGRTTAGASSLRDTLYGAGKQASDFLSNVPLVMDQRRQALMGGAGGFLSSLPYATQQDTNTTQTGMGGGGLGGFAGGLTSGLAVPLGQYAAQQNFAKTLKALGYGSG